MSPVCTGSNDFQCYAPWGVPHKPALPLICTVAARDVLRVGRCCIMNSFELERAEIASGAFTFQYTFTITSRSTSKRSRLVHGTSWVRDKCPWSSCTSARERVLLTRCERSQIFTKNILHVTVHSVQPVRLTYTMYRHAYRKPSVDTHMHS